MRKEEVTKKFDEIVDFSGVEKFIDTPVKRYSSGMYVRLAFAVAAHLDPEILIVDEVLAVGDAEFQKKCLGKMGDVAGEGRTVLFVSHNLLAIQTLCCQSLLLANGKIELIGNTDYVIARYITNFEYSDLYENDLANHKGRRYSKENAIKRIWIQNGDGTKTNIFKMAEKVIINFEFNAINQLENPAFGFGIEDYQANRIFTLNNYLVPSKDNSMKKIHKGVATLEIPSLPLLPGKYLITISIYERDSGYVDFVGQALSFEVIPSDVYYSGKIPDKNHGVIYIPGSVTVSGL